MSIDGCVLGGYADARVIPLGRSVRRRQIIIGQTHNVAKPAVYPPNWATFERLAAVYKMGTATYLKLGYF